MNRYAMTMLALVGCSGAAPRPTGPPLSAIRRTLIDQRPAGVGGWQTRLYLIEYPPLAEAPLHVHPAAGIGFVLEGSFDSAFGDEAVSHVTSGHGFVDQPAVTHRVFRNPSATEPLRFVIAYTLPDGEPPFRPLARGADPAPAASP